LERYVGSIIQFRVQSTACRVNDKEVSDIRAGFSDRAGCFLEGRLVVGISTFVGSRCVDTLAWLLERGVR
jgi:hypothetical protein